MPKCIKIYPFTAISVLRMPDIAFTSTLDKTLPHSPVKSLAECQTGSIRMRRRVARRLIQIQPVCPGSGSERGFEVVNESLVRTITSFIRLVFFQDRWLLKQIKTKTEKSCFFFVSYSTCCKWHFV